MEIALVVLGFILLFIGLLGAFLPVIPGPPLSFLGLVLIKLSGYGNLSSIFLWIWAGIVIAITVMDYILPSILARQFGGSRFAAIGSFLGLIVGIFFFPPWGMIIGPFLGAFAGEMIHNRNDDKKAVKVAFGAFLSFIVGTGAKLIVSSIMFFYAVKSLEFFQ